MAEENRQLRAYFEYNVNEQQKKNDELTAENQRLSEQLANKQRTTIQDTRPGQIQDFLEPTAQSEQEFKILDHDILPHNRQSFAQMDGEKQKRWDQNHFESKDVENKTFIAQKESNGNDLEFVHDQLTAQNKELEKQLEYYAK